MRRKRCCVTSGTCQSCRAWGFPGGEQGGGGFHLPTIPPTWSDCVPEDAALGDCHGRLTATAAGAAMM